MKFKEYLTGNLTENKNTINDAINSLRGLKSGDNVINSKGQPIKNMFVLDADDDVASYVQFDGNSAKIVKYDSLMNNISEIRLSKSELKIIKGLIK